MGINATLLFEEKQGLVFHAIKQKYGSYEKADCIARHNNMEFYDMVQIGMLALWRICSKHKETDEGSLNAYIIKTVQYRIMQEFHRHGLPIRFSDWCPREKRQSFQFQSIDAPVEDGDGRGFFAVDYSSDPADSVLNIVLIQDALQMLTDIEKYVLVQKATGYTDGEIGETIGKCRRQTTRIRTRAIKKINPNYVPDYSKVVPVGARSKRKAI